MELLVDGCVEVVDSDAVKGGRVVRTTHLRTSAIESLEGHRRLPGASMVGCGGYELGRRREQDIPEGNSNENIEGTRQSVVFSIGATPHQIGILLIISLYFRDGKVHISFPASVAQHPTKIDAGQTTS